MHDPMIVAFEIESPIKKKSEAFSNGYRKSIITIWHVDPEKNGNENSCDWHGRHRKLNAREKAITEVIWDLESILDNEPFYPNHIAHKHFQKLKEAVCEWKKVQGFRVHPRWHIHHWRIQIHFVQHLKRWLFSRCSNCGKRFTWEYAPIALNATKLKWFKGEHGVYHHECHKSKVGYMGDISGLGCDPHTT